MVLTEHFEEQDIGINMDKQPQPFKLWSGSYHILKGPWHVFLGPADHSERLILLRQGVLYLDHWK